MDGSDYFKSLDAGAKKCYLEKLSFVGLPSMMTHV